MTTSLPPGLSRGTADSRTSLKAPSSSLTAIRSAWNVRRAGWGPLLRAAAGTAAFTISTSCPAVSMGASSAPRR